MVVSRAHLRRVLANDVQPANLSHNTEPDRIVETLQVPTDTPEKAEQASDVTEVNELDDLFNDPGDEQDQFPVMNNTSHDTAELDMVGGVIFSKGNHKDSIQTGIKRKRDGIDEVDLTQDTHGDSNLVLQEQGSPGAEGQQKEQAGATPITHSPPTLTPPPPAHHSLPPSPAHKPTTPTAPTSTSTSALAPPHKPPKMSNAPPMYLPIKTRSKSTTTRSSPSPALTKLNPQTGRTQAVKEPRVHPILPSPVLPPTPSNTALFGQDSSLPGDGREEIWCTCRQPDDGRRMIACDAQPRCGVEWFHYECVGVKRRPRGRWLCGEHRVVKRGRGRGKERREDRSEQGD